MDLHPFLLAAALAAVPVAGQAHQKCAPHDEILAHLLDKYKERPVAIALADNKVVEITASEGGTWTLLVTDTRGWTCYRGTGEAFEILPESEMPKGPVS